MSPIRTTSLAFAMLLSLFIMTLSGCGDKNSQADLNSITGKHPADWLPTGHKVATVDHGFRCTECHGEDLSGGISNVACIKCHLGNQKQIHPVKWGTYAYALHSQFVNQNGSSSCAVASCHGTDLNGVGRAPSCSSCHLGGPTSAHPLLWKKDIISLHAGYIGQYPTSSCATAVCHGIDLKGAFLSGPACNTCHTNF